MRGLGLVAAAAIWLSAGGVAADAIGIVVTGACPSEAQVRAAIESRWSAATPGRWEARVVEVTGGARLQLVDGGGELVVDRTVQSRDCAAIAEAFALIVEMQAAEAEAETET